MANTRSMLSAAFVALLAAGSLATPAAAQGRWDWGGGGADDRRAYQLAGPGVPMLLPELRDTRHGQAFVMRNFDFNHDGLVSPREARAANDAFLEAAGPDRRRFDWERHAHRGPAVRLLDLATGMELARMAHTAPVTAMMFSPDSARLATRSGKTVALWTT